MTSDLVEGHRPEPGDSGEKPLDFFVGKKGEDLGFAGGSGKKGTVCSAF